MLDCALPKCIVCAGSTTNADLYQQCRLAEYASKVGNKQCLFAPIYKKYKKKNQRKWSDVVSLSEANSYVGNALSIFGLELGTAIVNFEKRWFFH